MGKRTTSLRIGAGASYAGDRVEPSTDLAANGKLDYMVYETLAERTIALANLQRMKDPNTGFNDLLEERFRGALPHCKRNGTRIVTNMGAANPLGAVAKTEEVIRDLKLGPMKVAAVLGDDVLDYCKQNADKLSIMESGKPLSSLQGEIVSANAYLGADNMVEALRQGADIVITGRSADCSLFLAPMIHEFGWAQDDWNLLGQGQVCADMVECGANVSGGFFADPGYKDVPDLGNLGYPYLDVQPDGDCVVGKVDGTGGVINRAICIEQMLYEIHDPSSYITPDVVVDFTKVKLEEIGRDQVRISGGRGRARPEQLKVSVGIREGWIGEAEITYAGLGCVNRAKLAEQVVRDRLRIGGVQLEELRVDYIGINSLHGDAALPLQHDPYEVRLRFAGRARQKRDAAKLAGEVETLVGKGPCASSLPRTYLREVLAIYSVLIPRSAIDLRIVMKEVA
ncbi:MAG TPA: acyclic terpene utilization AtuA family protein [Burkholderiales bacterium]